MDKKQLQFDLGNGSIFTRLEPGAVYVSPQGGDWYFQYAGMLDTVPVLVFADSEGNPHYLTPKPTASELRHQGQMSISIKSPYQEEERCEIKLRVSLDLFRRLKEQVTSNPDNYTKKADELALVYFQPFHHDKDRVVYYEIVLSFQSDADYIARATADNENALIVLRQKLQQHFYPDNNPINL